MSGFDFGGLRDPDAPQPDSHHREGVEMRAHELLTRARRWRMLASGLAFVAVAAAVVGVVATRESSPPKLSVTNHSTTTVAPTSSTSTSTNPGVVASSTTSTSVPTPTNAPAVSASFVSPQHGWVLQRGGAVAESTDGGLSWKSIANVGSLAYNESTPRIRFADAKRGFVHDNHDLFSTDDGGAHWQKVGSPFGRVVDLAISRGVVYLVAYDANANIFALWSSPTDHLAWSKDPVKIELGAGPVPFQQLVFSATGGWVINEDLSLIHI